MSDLGVYLMPGELVMMLVAFATGVVAGSLVARSVRLAVRAWLGAIILNTIGWVACDVSKEPGAFQGIVAFVNASMFMCLIFFGNILLCTAAGYGVGVLAAKMIARRHGHGNGDVA